MVKLPWIKRANQVFVVILSIQVVAAIVGGLFTDQAFMPVLLSALIIGFPLFLMAKQPYGVMTRHCVALGTQMMTALHIQIFAGLTELHFEIFTILAFLSWYRDWKIFVSSVAFVAVHHISFFVLQSGGSPFIIFEDGHLLVSILLTHAFFAVAEGTVLGVMARQNHDEAMQSLKLQNCVDEILSESGRIDLQRGCSLESSKTSPFSKLIWSFKGNSSPRPY